MTNENKLIVLHVYSYTSCDAAMSIYMPSGTLSSSLLHYMETVYNRYDEILIKFICVKCSPYLSTYIKIDSLLILTIINPFSLSSSHSVQP